ncbi:MAG: hypothetical protein AB1746_06985 [Candidatus Zixiibacteriota bacterium]
MTYIIRIIGSALILMLNLAGIAAADGDPGDFSIRFGMGYDFVSQEYFTSSSRYDTSLSPDPDLTDITLLSKDYLDDKKGLVYVTLNPRNEGRYILETGWEQTPDILRALGRGHLTVGGKDSRLESDFDFEIKRRCRGDAEIGEDLSVLKGKTKYIRRLSEQVESSLRIYGENVAFDSTSSLVYNYSRFGGELGFSIFTRNFNSIFFNAGVETRDVPDSSQLNFLQLRGSLGYFGSLGGSQISADLTIENKDYDSPDNRDDYLLITLYGNAKVPASENIFVRPLGNLEYFDFRSDEFINRDYLLARGGLLVGRDYSRISLALGPKFQLHSISSDYEGDDDYLEYMAFGSIDFFYSDRILCLIENQAGRRGYQNDPVYYSDFTFNRLSLIGSFKLLGTLNLDLLFSAEWEWHEIESDDSRLYLLSSGLSYTF